MTSSTTRTARIGGLLALLGTLGACGTTYDVPIAGEAEMGQARAMFAQEQNPEQAVSGKRLSGGMAVSQYLDVVKRVEPVAEQFCRSQTADKPAFNCDVHIVIDDRAPYRNAFQTYDENGVPIVGFTLPMIADARNPDELAFVLGHEFGHHIAEHMKKQQQQAMAGALILGAVAAYGQAQANVNNPYRSTAQDQRVIQNGMALGAGLGSMAYSQTFELESDVLGTYIAKAAGYDPVRGARFFARPEDAHAEGGALSFWGTHPPSERRLATVLAANARIQAAQPSN